MIVNYYANVYTISSFCLPAIVVCSGIEAVVAGPGVDDDLLPSKTRNSHSSTFRQINIH